ncbi:MAG: TetR/AcrR family transcriptional regulator [Vicinamibacterales bacterium]
MKTAPGSTVSRTPPVRRPGRAARTAATGTTDTRQAIFLAAAHEFAARGYDAGGVDRIAAEAGVNKAMIYYHFGSKQALYVEVLRDMFRTVGARGRTVAEGTGHAAAKLERWIVAMVEEISARPWFPPIMLRELASGAPHLDDETVELMNGVYGAVRRILLQGRREGAFRSVDPLLTHMTLMPALLIYFTRERVMETRQGAGLLAGRRRAQFVRHIQTSFKHMLQVTP